MSDAAHYQLFPELFPFHQDWLQTDTLHQVYFEECGSPEGIPVIFLHGGPGSGCNPAQRRFFDPKRYRIILMDQRGCGKSRPLGEIKDNTTSHLIDDIESLRQHLGIARWHVFGGSWGSTLALCYAIAHPKAVLSLTLRGIFLSRSHELRWFLDGVKAFFPEAFHALRENLPSPIRHLPILEAYKRLVFDSNEAVSIPAAIAWNNFESSIMTLMPPKPSTHDQDGHIELARARIQLHYIEHACFLGDRDLLSEIRSTLHNIPTVIVQGQYDMVCPPQTAWDLKQAMPHAEYKLIPDAGHSAMESGTRSALIEATEHFKTLGF